MKTENEPRVKRCRRTASFGFPIYPVRGLQKRQPAVLCQSRIATACKRALRIHHRRLQKGSSRRENRRIRCGNGGRADQ